MNPPHLLPKGHAWRRAGTGTLLGIALLLGACSNVTTTSSTPMGQVESMPSTPVEHDRRKAAMTRLELATSYMGINRLDVAMEEVNNALSIDSSLIDAYLVRGLILAQQQNFPAAEADYNRVLRARPNDADIIHNFGFMKCQQQQFDAADALFRQALAIPGYANKGRTLMAQGLCQQSAGKKSEAIATLQEANRLEPNNPIVSYNLAAMLYGQGNVSDAQFHLRRLNSSEFANAETLWLGIKVENALGNQLNVYELGGVLGRRFPQSREFSLYERKAFYE